MPRIQNIRSRRLLVDELIRAIQQIENQSSQGIAEVSFSIQENVNRLKGLIDLNKYDDTKVKSNIEQTKKELDSQIKSLKQMIIDHNKRVDENAHSISQMKQAVESEIQKLKAQPKVVNNKQEIVQKVDTKAIQEELARQRENQRVIAEYVKAHQEEQKKTNEKYQASLDKMIADFINSQQKTEDDAQEENYAENIQSLQNQILGLRNIITARNSPTFSHLEQNYYTKKDVDSIQSARIIHGQPNSLVFFNANSSLASNVTAFYVNEVSGSLSLGTNAPYKDATLFVQSIQGGTSDSYGAFVGKSYDTSVSNSAFIAGLGFVVQSTGNAYLSGQVKGLDGIVFHGGTGTANQLLGGQFLVQKTSTGPINVAYGANYAIMNTVATGAIGTGIGINVGSPISTGPITTSFGINVNNQCGANITNGAAIFIGDQTGSPGVNYSIYALGGKAGFNVSQTNGADFQILGASDANLFYADVSNNGVGFGTDVPKNKVDVAGAMVVGSAYAGINTAPSQGMLVNGTVSIGTTDFSSIPGATATVFSVISKVNSINNTGRGGMYFRTIQDNDAQETFGVYSLISTSGAASLATGTHILGAQNEIYLQNVGNSAAFDNANGVINFMEANGAFSHAIGINNIIYGNGNNTQTIGNVTIMPVVDGSGSHVGSYSYIQSINSTAAGVIGGSQDALSWSSPSATILAASVSAFSMGTVNNPTQKQVGLFIDWNIPGTDSNFAKWGMYVSSSQVDSAKAYFGDSVMLGKKPYVATGTNKPIGMVTLTAGTVDVSANTVTNSTVIMLTPQNTSGTAGSVYVAGRTAGTGFTVSSTLTADTRQVGYMMYEMTP